MSQELRTKFLEQEVRLSKSEVELERLKNEKLRAVIKTGVGRHFETRSKESKMAVDQKLEELESLRAEVGSKDRLDGFEQKISALEMANLKLSAHIKNLISETEREAYGKEVTPPKQNKQRDTNIYDESNQLDQQLSGPDTQRNPKKAPARSAYFQREPMLSVTPRSQKKDTPRQHPTLKRPPFAPRSATTEQAKHNDVIVRRPATTIAAPRLEKKEVGLRGPIFSNITPRAGNMEPSKHHGVDVRCQTSIIRRIEKEEQVRQYHNVRRQISINLTGNSAAEKEEAMRLLLRRPTTQATTPRTVRPCQKHKETCRLQYLNLTHATETLPKVGLSQQSPKKLIPRPVQVDRMAHQEISKELSIDLTLLNDEEEQDMGKDVQRPVTLKSSPRLNAIVRQTEHNTLQSRHKPTSVTSLLVNVDQVRHQEGDQRPAKLNSSPRGGEVHKTDHQTLQSRHKPKINVTRQLAYMDQVRHQDGDRRPAKLNSNPRGDEILQTDDRTLQSRHKPEINVTRQLANMDQVSHQDGDVLRQRKNCLSPRPDSRKRDTQEDEKLRQLLINITPRSVNLKDSKPASKSSDSSSSTNNNKSRPWYERLPIPDVDAFLVDDGSPESGNNTFSTDSDSSGKKPIICPIPSRVYDDRMYLGDQTALMPWPVIRKSCKLYVGNIDILTHEDVDSTGGNETFSWKSDSRSLTPTFDEDKSFTF